MDPESGRPTKRFKHQSYQTTLKTVHLPSAAVQSTLDEELPDTESHFQHGLEHWRQLTLTPAFNRFASHVYSLSASVPLLVYHCEEIVQLWVAAAKDADDSSSRALFDLLQKLIHDLRHTLQPYYMPLLGALLAPLARSLEAETLNILLATLSQFFKHLMGSDISVLEETWQQFLAVMVRCNPEIQRAVSEVWATVLRRTKGDNRKMAIRLILRDLDPIQDSGAWMFVYAFKSVAHTLHTCTPSLFTDLIGSYLQEEANSAKKLMLKRVLTALIHHCNNAEQFTPISDIIVSLFIDSPTSQLLPIMTVLSTVTSVRKGSRLSQNQLSKILTHLSQKDVILIGTEPVITVGAACLVAGDMPVWMSAGRRFIEASWQDPLLGMKLTGALSALDWGGWRLIELSFTLKHTGQLIESEPTTTLSLLSSLVGEGRLNDVDERWLGHISKIIQNKLASWDMGTSNLNELACILALCPVLSGVAPGLQSIAFNALEAIENDPDKIECSTKVFGTCVKVLAELPGQNIEFDIPSCISRAVKKWPQSQLVLDGLVVLSKRVKSTAKIALEDIYPHLQRSILNSQHGLRLSALRLLTSNIVQSCASSPALRTCLQGEEASLDLHGIRERVVRITGTTQIVKDGDDIGSDACIRWLIAQLQVNLRPLWLPTCKALATFSERFGDRVWSLVYGEIETIVNGGINDTQDSMDIDEESAMMEAERTWRDPSAAKLRKATEQWLKSDPVVTGIFEVKRDRLDVHNYEHQLLVALAEAASLTQRHNAEIIRLFLSFGSPELSSKPPRARLLHWLTMFSKLDNPKAFHRTATLQTLYKSLLAHPDRNLHTVALTCILNYKSPHLVPYKNQLHGLLDVTKWRDELTAFDLSTTVEGADRPELIDLIIRLFYGMMLERHGRTKGRSKRASLLNALGACQPEELKLLVDLMLEPFGLDANCTQLPTNLDWSDKQRAGFLNLMGDVIKRMGPRIVAYWPSLFLVTIECVAYAQRRLDASSEKHEDKPEGQPEEEDDELEAVADELAEFFNGRALRSLRQLGVKRLTDFFRLDLPFDFGPYLSTAFSAVVSPRLAALERENTQSPSALLELFHVWSTQERYVRFLVNYDDRLLPKIYACLQAQSVKPVVIARIFDIIEHTLALSTEYKDVANDVLKPQISFLLDALTIDLSKSGNLLQRQVAILSQIAQFATIEDQARRLLQHFTPLLKRPSKAVPEKAKVHLLKITQGIIPMVPDFKDPSSATSVQTYDMLCKLFQILRIKSARIALLDVFGQLRLVDPSLERVYGILGPLNAFSAKRVEEPDFERRLEGFSSLNESLYDQLTLREWQPILYNMLLFIQDPEELAIRTNAAYSFRRFMDVLTTKGSCDIENMFMRILFPALKRGLLSKEELVRNEILGVLAYGIAKCDSLPALSELRPLQAGGDKEADFFNNVHHIQIHRRTRALRRLSEYVDGGNVRSATIAELFLPLIGHFITNAPDMDHILVDVAIATTGVLARHVSWGAYNNLVKHYMNLVKAKTPAERACIRAVVAVLENFHFPMDEEVEDEDEAAYQKDDDKEAATAEEEVAPEVVEETKAVPTKSASSIKKIAEAVNGRLLPSLLKHLESRDENEDSLRIPVSVGIAKVTCYLPAALKDAQISRLLTILSQVFRSKSQETRILARESLCKVAVIIGPDYLPKIMTELRAALLRGTHLHILAVVVHALIVHVTSGEAASTFTDLDSCATDAAHVSAEVIFGQSGNDVRSEGFKTTVLEVKGSSSKALDTFSILARSITPARISSIISPIKGVMHETSAAKAMQLVDEVLKRISSGLNANERLNGPEYISLCHALIQQNAKFLMDAPCHVTGKVKGKNFIVQTKRRLDTHENHYAQNSYRFVVFGLDLFNVAFRRGRYSLQDPEILSRLEAMVPVIGNTLFSQEAAVVFHGLKATALVVKCPLKANEEGLPVFVKQIMHLVRQAGNTESEVVQTAFRTLVVIIRDCKSSEIKEKDLSYLIELITVDLEEPDRQAAVFALLRAIISRKFVVVEIYDIMDRVEEIMVTNQSGQVQEVCRAVLLQFLLDYPQGKGRLKNQINFLAKNLSYVFESGRKSVMELLNAIFLKFDQAILREYAELFFVALVMVIANDDASKCREMAAELIKLLIKRVDVDFRKTVISHLHTWSSGKAQIHLSRVSAHVYGLVIDTLQQDITQYSSGILADMNVAITQSAINLRELEAQDNQDMEVDVEWQLPYHALNAVFKTLRVQPELVKTYNAIVWSDVAAHLLFPHAWVRGVSSRLIGLLFTTIPPASPDTKLADSYLLSLTGLIEIARCSCLQLKSETLDATSGVQIVKNLLYIGKCFSLVSVKEEAPGPEEKEGEGESEDEEEADGDDAQIGLEPEDKLENIKSNPLPWLFSKLSYQARSAWLARRNKPTIESNWFEQPTVIFRWFAAMSSHMEPSSLEKFLVHMLNPVYRYIDDDTIRDTAMDDLRTLAQELTDLIQEKVGTTKFGEVYNAIRQNIATIRRERRTDRVVLATKDPQAAARRKIVRNQIKKNSRARSTRDFADKKIRVTSTKVRRRIEK
ncbi:hypothetical protein M422DRAFT_203512 [Sphaerobolus stellatus SS14]|nr:hypothetical protein M422DRAFT_203512 [Sphaerobolus stellatus SS14]